MRDWNTPLQETLSEVIADLASGDPVRAAIAFKMLREAVEPPEAIGSAKVVLDGVSHGTVRRAKSGVAIKLSPTAEEHSLKPLVIGIGNALKELGFK
jgi:hypothetical protein